MAEPQAETLTPEERAYYEAAARNGSYRIARLLSSLRAVERERDHYRKAYYDVADAITAESGGPEDLAAQARGLRKRCEAARREALEEAARHCESTDLPVYVEAFRATRREFGTAVCHALAAELRALSPGAATHHQEEK